MSGSVLNLLCGGQGFVSDYKELLSDFYSYIRRKSLVDDFADVGCYLLQGSELGRSLEDNFQIYSSIFLYSILVSHSEYENLIN